MNRKDFKVFKELTFNKALRLRLSKLETKFCRLWFYNKKRHQDYVVSEKN